MSATVVADSAADVFRDAVEVLEQVFQAGGLQVWMFLQRRVQVGDVGLMMLGVMDFHRPRVDMRFQGVVGVGQ